MRGGEQRAERRSGPQVQRIPRNRASQRRSHPWGKRDSPGKTVEGINLSSGTWHRPPPPPHRPQPTAPLGRREPAPVAPALPCPGRSSAASQGRESGAERSRAAPLPLPPHAAPSPHPAGHPSFALLLSPPVSPRDEGTRGSPCFLPLASPPLPVAQVAGVLRLGAAAQQQPQPQEQRQEPGGRGAPHGPPAATPSPGPNAARERCGAMRAAPVGSPTWRAAQGGAERSGYPMPDSALRRFGSALKFAAARLRAPS